MKTVILTHRGLKPCQKDFYSESSCEAFTDHLNRGFGIEFDFNVTKDERVVILHDKDLRRITQGKDRRWIANINAAKLTNMSLGNGRICFFEEIMQTITKAKAKINAFHIKGHFQEKNYLDLLLSVIQPYKEYFDKLILFDLKPDSAQYLLKNNPNLILAPSVAHNHDIKRYNQTVYGTLLSIKEALDYKALYKWVWLDEWDRTNGGQKDKIFYTQTNFNQLRSVGYKIALVTPELHGTSPGLLGSESHQDAKNKKKLLKRIREIISLHPDAICTDYPEEVCSLL